MMQVVLLSSGDKLICKRAVRAHELQWRRGLAIVFCCRLGGALIVAF